MTSAKAFETIICIPGTWESRTDFIVSIVATSSGEYIAAGDVLINGKKQNHYKIEFCEHDESMEESFGYAGKVTGVSEDFLKEIKNHKYVVYLSGSTGNLNGAKDISYVADAILKSGGIGIKIETGGKAFEKQKWHNLLENFDEANLYQMFVIDSIMTDDASVYSCGMQNLSFKDTIVSGVDFQEAVDLISTFGYYQIIDKPRIRNMQTFTKTIESPKFRITEESNQPNLGHAFENPFGMWRLGLD